MTTQSFTEDTAASDIQTAFTVRLYEPHLRERLDGHSKQKGISKAAFIQQLLSVILNLDFPHGDDVIENIEIMFGVMNRIDWDELKNIEKQLKNDHLTKRANLQDVAVAMIDKGVKVHNATRRC